MSRAAPQASNDNPAPDPADRAAAVDQHVGARIRERRTLLGITQQQLAATLGITYQQAHKYERGHNRVSAGRLYEIAEALAVPVSFFFDGAEEDAGGHEPSQRQRLTLELARNFAAIDNEKHQDAVSQLARALAEPEAGGDGDGGDGDGKDGESEGEAP